MIFSSFIFYFAVEMYEIHIFNPFTSTTSSQLACSSSATPVMQKLGFESRPAWIFQPFFPRNCGISCVFNCDDLLFIYFLHSAVAKYEIHIFIVSFSVVRLNSLRLLPTNFKVQTNLDWLVWYVNFHTPLSYTVSAFAGSETLKWIEKEEESF